MLSHIYRVAGLCCIGLLAACANGFLVPSSYSFTTQQMQTALNKKFPIEKDYSHLISIQLLAPKISTQADTQRIVLQFASQIDVLGNQSPIQGMTTVSSGLAYHADTHTIALSHPQLDSQRLDGVSSTVVATVSQLMATAIHDRLEGAVVYTLSPEQLQLWGQHVEPDHLEVTAQGVTVYRKKN